MGACVSSKEKVEPKSEPKQPSLPRKISKAADSKAKRPQRNAFVEDDGYKRPQIPPRPVTVTYDS